MNLKYDDFLYDCDLSCLPIKGSDRIPEKVGFRADYPHPYGQSTDKTIQR